jgi:hypothetical protein
MVFYCFCHKLQKIVKNKTKLSYNSGGQKPDVGLPGLKSRWWQLCSLRRFWGRIPEPDFSGHYHPFLDYRAHSGYLCLPKPPSLPVRPGRTSTLKNSMTRSTHWADPGWSFCKQVQLQGVGHGLRVRESTIFPIPSGPPKNYVSMEQNADHLLRHS